MRIYGGRTLAKGVFAEADVEIDEDEGVISHVGGNGANGNAFDARGLTVLPGIVDIHGDAFERQLMPRPGVGFPVDVALAESDRQVIANGITTVYHGVTWSWEPGLRGSDNARAVLGAIEEMRPKLSSDTRFHLRHETFNLDAEAEVSDWLASRRIDMLGFNDHLPSEDIEARTKKLNQMSERAGLSREDFLSLVAKVRRRANEVPHSIAKLAKIAGEHGVPTLSHDDMSIEQRRWFRAIDCRVAEFPTNAETAEEATAAGDDIVLGAPNVVRGGSHIGWIGAAEMISRGFCTVLASDYYYPAPLLAAFRLAADGMKPLEEAWAYVSERPAKAAKLPDRGTIEVGRRADLIAVDASDGRRPRVVATIANGRVVYLIEPSRLR